MLRQPRTCTGGSINPAESPKLPFTLQGINWMVQPEISIFDLNVTATQSVWATCEYPALIGIE